MSSLRAILADLRAGRSFYHSRYAADEVALLLDLPKDNGCLPEDNRCQNRELILSLRRTFMEVCRRKNDAFRIEVGGHSALLADWLLLHGLDGGGLKRSADGPFCPGEIDELLEVLRDSNRCVLVGSERLTTVVKALGATFVLIPETDEGAWAQRERIGEILRFSCQTMLARIYLWCAGVPAKPWSWQIRRRDPHSTHIDLGDAMARFLA